MPQRLGSEAAYLDIVFQHGERLADSVDFLAVEPPLKLEAGPPGEDATDVEPFALDLHEHVAGQDTLGRTRVMSATGGVDVMVAAVVAVLHRIDPAFEL